MLALVNGVPLIKHVYERVRSLGVFDHVFVATDHFEIQKLFSNEEVVLTKEDHHSGTSRIIEAVNTLNITFDYMVNIQGDEALISEKQLLPLINILSKDNPTIASLMTLNNKIEEFKNPNCVKLVCDKDDNALYFSRAGIPFLRDNNFDSFYQHLGVYAFKSEVLGKLQSISNSALEQKEKLEQLSWLYAGYKIKMVEVPGNLIGVDTPNDLEKVNQIIKGHHL